MDLNTTVGMLSVACVLAAFSLWSQRRERPIGALRFPATPVLAITMVIVVVSLAHLVTLLTGVPVRGRLG